MPFKTGRNTSQRLGDVPANHVGKRNAYQNWMKTWRKTDIYIISDLEGTHVWETLIHHFEKRMFSVCFPQSNPGIFRIE
jgi:hypothetical protein